MKNKLVYLSIKRVTDLVTSISILILLLPVFIFISILIKISSNGSILYKWNVIGLRGKPFIGYKFRTMVEDADIIKEKLTTKNEMSGPAFKMSKDPRITPVGAFLRKYSIDELPQLWSVLKGDMSLVGPRPPLQSEWKNFEEWHRMKTSIKPGITCLWQINGRNEIHSFDDWVKLDLEYIDNQSFWLDIKILCKTIPAIIKGTGK